MGSHGCAILALGQQTCVRGRCECGTSRARHLRDRFASCVRSRRALRPRSKLPRRSTTRPLPLSLCTLHRPGRGERSACGRERDARGRARTRREAPRWRAFRRGEPSSLRVRRHECARCAHGGAIVDSFCFHLRSRTPTFSLFVSRSHHIPLYSSPFGKKPTLGCRNCVAFDHHRTRDRRRGTRCAA